MIQHLRNYSNYLAPPGSINKLLLPVIVVLGLSINLLVILPLIILIALIFVALILFSKYRINAYLPFLNGNEILLGTFVHIKHFPILLLLILIALWSMLYAVVLSLSRPSVNQDSRRSLLLRISFFIALSILAVAFLYIQHPILIKIQTATAVDIKNFYVIVAGGAGVIGILISLFRNVIQRIGALVARLWRVGLGLVAPLLIWCAMLFIEYTVLHPDAFFGYLLSLKFVTEYLNPFFHIDMMNCKTQFIDTFMGLPHTGEIQTLGCMVIPTLVYVSVAIVLLMVSFFLVDVNGTSLHNFYRDRLQDAYLPRRIDPQPSIKAAVILPPNRGLKLSRLSNYGPFHILNTSINIQRSKTNLRGRNAALFTFSKTHVGSDCGYEKRELSG